MLVDHGGRGLGLPREPPPCGAGRGHPGGQELDRHQPVEGPVPGQEHDAHPAPADQAKDVVGAELAQVSRLVGGFEQAHGDVLIVRRHRLGALRPVACGRAGRIVAKQRQVVPEAAPGRQPVEGAAAVRAGVEVGDHLRLVDLGQVVPQQAKQPIRTGAVRHVESPGKTRRNSKAAVWRKLGSAKNRQPRHERQARSCFRGHPALVPPSI